MSEHELDLALLAGTLILLAAVAAVRVSTRAGLPSLLIYLAIGLVIGEAGIGLDFEDAELTQTLGLVALAVILAEGGLTTQWRVIRPVLGLSITLATLGVAISVSVTATVAYLVLPIDGRTAILLGAVLSSTDAAAVFSVLRRLPIGGRIRATLEAESGFNDAPAIILVTLVVSDAWSEATPASVLFEVVYQLGVGAVVGLAIAFAGHWMLARGALPAAGLYPLATMAITLLAYATAGVAGGSGFLAVYVAALRLGHARLPHRNATLGFAEGLAWMAQIGLFILLGLLASPAELPGALLPALAVGAGLLLLARPLSIALCATPFRVSWRDQAFISWAGLRGAVPIVLATIPLSMDLPAADQIFAIVFVLVVVFTLIQAQGLLFIARWLGVTEDASARELQVESAPLEAADAGLIQLTVPAHSRLAGVYVHELRLPYGAAISLVVRRGQTLVPEANTVLATGDHLLLVTTNAARDEAERRLRSINRAGRLARWYGDAGEATPGRETRPKPDIRRKDVAQRLGRLLRSGSRRSSDS